jgi:hypothetical protein
MSDAKLVAGQIADVREALERAIDVMSRTAPPTVNVNVPESPAPSVSVRASDVPGPIVLNMPGPAPQIVVNVPEAPPADITVRQAEITVLPPVARAYNCRVTERDSDGFILAFTITPA